MPELRPGRYRHYKGNEYTVLDTVRHSESEEELVLYRQEYGDRALWVRPKAMFSEAVKVDGQDVPRFRFLEAESTNEVNAENLLASVPSNLPDELFEVLLSRSNVRIERIVSHGHSSPKDFWYDQNEHEFVVVLQGVARLRFEDGEIELRSGSFVEIPAHKRHRVEWTTPDEPTVWLAIHYAG